MIKYVVITALSLISTKALAHDANACQIKLIDPAFESRMLKIGEDLSQYAAEIHIEGVHKKIVAMQIELGRIRASSQSGVDVSLRLDGFEMKLAYLVKTAWSDSYYNRGVQHPDRPMKRETLGTELENWPQDWSGGSSQLQTRRSTTDRGAQHPDRPMKRETLYFENNLDLDN